jgi:hypothetical protein
VGPDGLDPSTHGLKVHHSIDRTKEYCEVLTNQIPWFSLTVYLKNRDLPRMESINPLSSANTRKLTSIPLPKTTPVTSFKLLILDRSLYLTDRN